jgi:hypothetical protein
VTVRATVVVWLNVPLVPVTVTVAAPKVAVLDAVNVRTLLVPVVVVVAGLKLAVAPVGRPLTVKATAPANPPVRVMVIVLVPLAPCATDKLVGLAESEKSGAVTVRLIVVVCVSPPPVPVTVTVAAPKVAVLEAVNVRTLLVPVMVVVAGLKLAVGNPDAVKVTALANPFNLAMVIVLVPLALRATVKLAGLAEREKSGVAGA